MKQLVYDQCRSMLAGYPPPNYLQNHKRMSGQGLNGGYRSARIGSASPQSPDIVGVHSALRVRATTGLVHCSKQTYSITSSAVASRVGGTVRPSALAVLRLM